MRCLGLLFSLLFVAPAFAQLTDNHVLHAVPAPGAVKIDGSLEDWDLSGQILTCPNVQLLRDTVSARVAMMYDKDALYVAADWLDPTPMLNNYDPQFDRRTCFQSDSLELHFKTDLIRQVIGWYYTKGKAPAVCVTDGDKWYDARPIVYLDGLKELGIAEAFTEHADHKGYVQELRIPWKAIYKDLSQAPKAGDQVQCMLDLDWGPDAGTGWPVAHSMDLVKPGAAHGDWFWNIRDIRGAIVLEPTGHLKLAEPTYAAKPSHLRGPVAIRAQIPADAKRFTVAINDASGARVRNLAGDFDSADYTVAQDGNRRTVEVNWDCTSDAGKLVAPGSYSVIGLTRGDLSATYEMHFYNPGAPPWETRDGTGGWGSDHTAASTIAAAGDSIIVGYAGAESGCGLLCIGPDGKKTWGALKGVTALAADDQSIYVITADMWTGATAGLGRLKRDDGSYQPYTLDGKPTFPLPMAALFGGKDKVPGPPIAIAVHHNVIAMALRNGEIVFVDASTGKLLGEKISVGDVKSIAYLPNGDLYVLCQPGHERIPAKPILSVIRDAQPKPVDLPADISKPVAIAVASDGKIAIADGGPDAQVKLFDPATQKIVATFGKKGGRKLHASFDSQGMYDIKSIAFDSTGRLWVVEGWDYPRRISVWKKDGALDHDFIGNTAYGAGGCYLHDTDPNLAYVGPMEFKLDKAAHTSALTQTLWVPDTSAGESFLVPYAALTNPQRLTSSASGQPHEYLYSQAGPQVIFMPRGPEGRWQPVAGVFYVSHVSGYQSNDFDGKNDKKPTGDFAGMNLRDGLIWSDKNRDGKVQLDECVVIKAEGEQKLGHKVDGHGPAAKMKVGNGDGGRIGQDLSIYANGVVRYKPSSYTDDGAPVFDAASMQPMTVIDRGDLVPFDAENKLIICSATGYGQTSYLRAVDLKTQQDLWRHPLYDHGVHGSHWAGMPEPGKPIGVIKLLGVAKISDSVGGVCALRGNLGQDFFITTDGLYVGSMFHDCRIPSPPFPTNETDLYGKDISQASEGSEPFNGWFGVQSDGGVRLCNGMAGLAGTIVQLHGFDSIQRFTAPSVMIEQSTLAAAQTMATTQPSSAGKTFAVRKLTSKELPAGKPINWPGDVHPIELGADTQSAQIRMGYDDVNLYVEYRVNDPTPIQNEGQDFTRLFKTGDACDLQLSTDPAAKPHGEPMGADERLVFSQLAGGKPVAVLMRPVDPTAPADARHTYSSPVGSKNFARVQILSSAKVTIVPGKTSYTLTAIIPLSSIGLSIQPGMTIRGDVGVIFSDAQGRINTANVFWANPHTTLVSDMPIESWLYPAMWGELKF